MSSSKSLAARDRQNQFVSNGDSVAFCIKKGWDSLPHIGMVIGITPHTFLIKTPNNHTHRRNHERVCKIGTA